jgi:hypothetical protein
VWQQQSWLHCTTPEYLAAPQYPAPAGEASMAKATTASADDTIALIALVPPEF